MNTVLITGSSSGIGRAAAQLFHERGWNVVATMRTPAKSDLSGERMLLAPLDVTDDASIASAIAAGITRFGTIDAVVNNAGFGMTGPFEGSTQADVQRQFDTNVFGLMNVTRAILPHMRERRSGTIVNVSSIGGRLTFPFYSLYHATKWAVEGFTESLQFEVEAYNIRMKLVEPGPIKTDFYDRSADILSSAPYERAWTATKALMDKAGATGATPERVAAMIVRAASDRSQRLRYPVNGLYLRLQGIIGQRAWHAIARANLMRA